jgi:hypothetical protein
MPDEPKPLPIAKCPFCDSDLPTVQTRQYGTVVLICCGSCMKVIGGTYEAAKQ